MSAESVGGSTPVVKVTWSTTALPECVAYVRVVFRRSTHGVEVTRYTTNNTSGMHSSHSESTTVHVLQSTMHVRVFVAAVQTLSGVELQSMQNRVVVGGKENCVHA